jgi:hypothetical protein
VLGDRFAVPGNDFDPYAELCEAPNRLGRVFFWPVQEREKSREGQIVLEVPTVLGNGVERSPGDGQDPDAAGAPLLIALLEPRLRCRSERRSIRGGRAHLHDLVKGPFGDETGLAISIDDDADALPDEVKRDLRELADGGEIRHAAGENGFVERVLQSRLERCVQGRQLLHLG